MIFDNGDAMVDPKLHFFGSKWGKTQSFEFGDWGRNESSHFCEWEWTKMTQNRTFLGQNGSDSKMALFGVSPPKIALFWVKGPKKKPQNGHFGVGGRKVGGSPPPAWDFWGEKRGFWGRFRR